MVQRRRRFHRNLQELWPAIDLGDGSDQQAFRKDLIAAAGEHRFTNFHVFFGHHFVENQFS